MKKCKNIKDKIIVTLLAAAIVVFSPAVLWAEANLEELNNKIAEYQLDHLKRANEIKAEMRRVHEVEAGLAKQYNMPLSEILKYETVLSNLEGIYDSHHYLLAAAGDDNADLYDDEKFANLLITKPPYDFEFYFDLVQHLNYYKGRLEQVGNSISTGSKYIEETADRKIQLEEEYRRLLELYDNASEERVKYKFKLIICETQIERCYADIQYVQAQIENLTFVATDLKDKIAAINPVIKKVREKIGQADIDYTTFDDIVRQYVVKLNRSENDLIERYRQLVEMERTTSDKRKFVRYCIATEKEQVESEIYTIIEIRDLWMGVRFAIRLIGDIIDDDVTHGAKGDRESAKIFINDMKQRCESENILNQRQLEDVRQTYQDVNDVNNNSEWVATSADAELRAKLCKEMDNRIERYSYIRMMCNEVAEHLDILAHEIEVEDNTKEVNKQINSMLVDSFISVLDREVWHVDDYSVTVVKILKALMILLCGFVITRFVVFLLRRRLSKRHVRNNMIKLVLYTIFAFGMILSFLIVLWVLHIPFTAFAFLGGAGAIALGFGAQKTAGDILAGLFLLVQDNLRVGDAITIDGKTGTVEEITLHNTILRCDETEIMIIPNSKLMESPVLNSTLNNFVVRETINIQVSDENDIARTTEIISAVLDKSPYVLKTPKYRVLLSEYKDGTSSFVIHVFVNAEKELRVVMQYSIKLEIVNALLANGIIASRPCADITVTKAKEDTKEDK